MGGKRKVSSSQALSQSQSNKKLSDADQKRLMQSIINNGFFQTNSIYPPDPMGPQDYTLNVLGTNMDNNSHTVLWTNTSGNVPTGLNSIVKTIRRFSFKIEDLCNYNGPVVMIPFIIWQRHTSGKS